MHTQHTHINTCSVDQIVFCHMAHEKVKALHEVGDEIQQTAHACTRESLWPLWALKTSGQGSQVPSALFSLQKGRKEERREGGREGLSVTLYTPDHH